MVTLTKPQSRLQCQPRRTGGLHECAVLGGSRMTFARDGAMLRRYKEAR